MSNISADSESWPPHECNSNIILILCAVNDAGKVATQLSAALKWSASPT